MKIKLASEHKTCDLSYIKLPNTEKNPSKKNSSWSRKELLMIWFFVAGVLILATLQSPWVPWTDEAIECESMMPFDPSCATQHPLCAEQVHLSMGSNPKQMYVTFSTRLPAAYGCYINYHAKSLYRRPKISHKPVRAIATYWSSTGENGLFYHSHSNNDGVTYKYQIFCRGKSNQTYPSAVYSFKTRPSNKTSANLAVYGDLGLINAKSIPHLSNDLQRDMYDAIIHNGDFAYDLDTDNGKRGDEFMRRMEPMTSRVPYMTSAGNHEIKYNFSHYDNRFTMINQDGKMNNFYYSFDIGPVHFIAINTEFYYFLDYVGIVPLYNQYKWLEEDLLRASGKREEQPWIIVFGHRPFYCSVDDNDDCTKGANIIRKGLGGFVQAFGLEKLFYNFGVDVLIWSHEHEYERFLPVYDEKVYNGTTDPKDPYLNPRAPVHLITGSAGCQENLDRFNKTAKSGSVKRVSDYGYTRLVATKNELRFEQVSADKLGTILDKFVVSKSKQNFPLSRKGIDL